MTPAFSIIMPVWNRAHRVSTAIESVLAQTCRDYELIIVDDGSEDDLESAVRAFLSPRVRLVSIPHRGVSAARNAGLSEAQGEWIAYLDSDNTWRPEFLETMQRILESDPAERRVAYAQAEVHEHLNHKHPAGLRVAGSPFSLKEMLTRNLIDQNTVVHARSCLELVAGYDESLCRFVDWDFLMRLTARFEPIFVEEILVDYSWGLEPNAISLTQDLAAANVQVRENIASRVLRDADPACCRIKLTHDMTEYILDDVPVEKYDNWFRMRLGPYDTKTFRPNGYPHMLQIEPTRPEQNMSLDQFQSIVDDMRRWLLFAVLWGRGEPFTNPRLPDMIRYAADAGIRTVTSTNADYLGNEDYVASILGSGLTTLIVDIDSPHDTDYRSCRPGAKLERAELGLQTLVDLKRKLGSPTLINFRMVVMRHNENKIAKLRRYARKTGADRFTVKTMNPFDGNDSMAADLVPHNPGFRRFACHKGTRERIPIRATCDRAITMSNIFSNGDVAPCCYDHDSSMKIGNAFETPFTQLWMSPEYQEARRRIHEERQFLEHCRNCHINFQLSKKGWFVEVSDLTRPPFWNLRRYFQKG